MDDNPEFFKDLYEAVQQVFEKHKTTKKRAILVSALDTIRESDGEEESKIFIMAKGSGGRLLRLAQELKNHDETAIFFDLEPERVKKKIFEILDDILDPQKPKFNDPNMN